MMRLTVEQLALLIPIVSIILGIGVAFWAIYWNHATKRLQFEERRAMIEKGMIPPEMPPEDARHHKLSTPEDNFRTGIIMTFLGVGLLIARFFLRDAQGDGPPPWVLGAGGAIVGMIGIGCLVYYFLRKDQLPEDRHRP